ncbi:MAG TPA: UDP-N-acetylglucosamine 2-epimerase (non-hydrolyzing) [bacterium]|nr:UDP-N-acetylglucosamine 2-epimerase (non-hydrolyzing) [bacterium]
MVVFGTRPDAVKMAPVVRALRTHPVEFTPIVAVTAQHREMLDQVLSLFAITPDHDLGIMTEQQSLVDITVRTLEGLSALLPKVAPDLVLVQGDAAPSFVGSLAAFYRRIPVGHVEAGLRTADKYQPFPEEMYRRMTTVLADLHFAPTSAARENLKAEGVPGDRILVTGNTVIDALLEVVRRDRPPADPRLRGVLAGRGRRVLLLTTHRRENWGEPQRRIFLAVREILDRFPDLDLVFPVHPNPVVSRPAREILGGHPRAHLSEPLDYATNVACMKAATVILTDSGGIQEEAPSLGRPVLVLRETTERPEGIAAGTARLVGTDHTRIVQETSRLLTDPRAYARMSLARNPYGDGHAAERIVGGLRRYFGFARNLPREFSVHIRGRGGAAALAGRSGSRRARRSYV